MSLLGFRDPALEQQYQRQRCSALRSHDQQVIKVAWLMNVMFNVFVFQSRRGFAAAVLYSTTLVFQTCMLYLLKPETYTAYRNTIAGACRLLWHTASWWGLKDWSEPYLETLPAFVKLVFMVSGIVALNWLQVFTLTSTLLVNIALQVISAAGYVGYYTPQLVCPQMLLHDAHVGYLDEMWHKLNKVVGWCSQVMLLPAEPKQVAPSPSIQCWHALVFLQVVLGLLIPCIMAAAIDHAARKRFLWKAWRQQQQQQAQQQQAQLSEGSSSAACTCVVQQPQQQQRQLQQRQGNKHLGVSWAKGTRSVSDGEADADAAAAVGFHAMSNGNASSISPKSSTGKKFSVNSKLTKGAGHAPATSPAAIVGGARAIAAASPHRLECPCNSDLSCVGICSCLFAVTVALWHFLQDASYLIK